MNEPWLSGDEFRIPVRCYKVKLFRTKNKIQICNSKSKDKYQTRPNTDDKSATSFKVRSFYTCIVQIYSFHSSPVMVTSTPVYYVGSGYGTGTGILSCKRYLAFDTSERLFTCFDQVTDFLSCFN